MCNSSMGSSLLHTLKIEVWVDFKNGPQKVKEAFFFSILFLANKWFSEIFFLQDVLFNL